MRQKAQCTLSLSPLKKNPAAARSSAFTYLHFHPPPYFDKLVSLSYAATMILNNSHGTLLGNILKSSAIRTFPIPLSPFIKGHFGERATCLSSTLSSLFQ